MIAPYFEDDAVTLYLGDCREVLPALGFTVDLILADPPYGETSLTWDRWPGGWLEVAASVSSSLWCFGSMRMFLENRDQFSLAGWKLSQDLIWQKNAGSSFASDRFKRVHETAVHWYRGQWRDIHTDVPRERYTGPSKNARRNPPPPHTGKIGTYLYEESGTRLMRSIVPAKQIRHGIHPTQKPLGILTPLIEYACPPGGLVVDPFAGSCSTLEAARLVGRRAIGIETDERYAERAVRRLAQATVNDEQAAELITTRLGKPIQPSLGFEEGIA